MNTNTILIVDDQPNNIDVLSKFLRTAGFEILIAKNGKRAIKKAEYANPDLILLDIKMPEMDGFETCRVLKSQLNTQDIPIIFMTALTETKDKLDGFKLGAVDYITKPFQHEKVLARVNAHLTIRKQNQQLRQNQKETEAFARTVAHDLKNPVANILTLTELLLFENPDNITDDEKTKTIQIIHNASQQAHNIINDLLILCGISQQKSLKTEPLCMDKIIKPIIQEHLATLIEKQQAQIDLPTSWPTVLGYAPWVEEIWINYIINGLKYGGQPPKLTLGSDYQEDNKVRFWICDNGKGISQKEIAKLFTPFTRLHKERAEGHGLGLSIVRQIVERLGGEVGVESQIGQGSQFYFTLPVV